MIVGSILSLGYFPNFSIFVASIVLVIGINWLIQNGHKQYFIIDDFKNSRLKVETFLFENDINYPVEI